MARLPEARLGKGRSSPRPSPRPQPAKAANPLDEPAISTRPPRCISAASRPAPTAAIPARCIDPDGKLVGEVGDGNRKDIRNAVEAARAALGWAHHRRPYPRADPLFPRRKPRLSPRRIRRPHQGADRRGRRPEEVALSVERLFAFAGWADKYDGAVHNPPLRAIAAAMVEPLGVMGIVAPPAAAAAGLHRADRPGARHGQYGGAGALRARRRCRSPTSTRCIETSDVPIGRHQHRHRRQRRRWPRRWPSMTASTPCGSPAMPKPRPWSKRPRSAISSRPGPAAGSTTTWPTGASRATTSSARPRRSRTSGFPTGRELDEPPPNLRLKAGRNLRSG